LLLLSPEVLPVNAQVLGRSVVEALALYVCYRPEADVRADIAIELRR